MTLDEPAVPPVYAAPTLAPQPRSNRLGLVAMLIGIGVFVLSLLTSVAMGSAAAPYAVRGSSGFNVTLSAASGDPVESMLAMLAFVHIALGTAFGVWAIVQGIIAIATKRGRGFGIVAAVFAFLAPGLSLLIYFAVAISAAN